MIDEDFNILNINKYYLSGATRPLSFRIGMLRRLRQAILSNEQKITEALNKDLGKSEFEAYATEIGFVLEEIKFISRRLKKWIKKKPVPNTVTHFGTKGYTIAEPYGVVLIIAPWNYPFQLCLSPLVGAIAAGNCVVVKPSELTPHTSIVIKEIIESIYDINYIQVVEGGVDVSEHLLNQPFNYIFFTGSTEVGKKVMRAASDNLIPLTLELGGKSPCIVHNDADIPLAAKRIIWGKLINAGQTCVAPDYVYVHESEYENFINHIIDEIKNLYGLQPINNSNFARIINKKHFHRLINLFEISDVVYGGLSDESLLKISPTILKIDSWHHKVMSEEIFGPILPILTYENIDECFEAINSRSTPLAAYFFTKSNKIQNMLVNRIASGGVCINDTLMHMVTPHLPFGGKGSSGMGQYHGEYSFKTFSHEKSVLKQTNFFDIPFRYPNYKNALYWIKKIMR